MQHQRTSLLYVLNFCIRQAFKDVLVKFDLSRPYFPEMEGELKGMFVTMLRTHILGAMNEYAVDLRHLYHPGQWVVVNNREEYPQSIHFNNANNLIKLSKKNESTISLVIDSVLSVTTCTPQQIVHSHGATYFTYLLERPTADPAWEGTYVTSSFNNNRIIGKEEDSIAKAMRMLQSIKV